MSGYTRLSWLCGFSHPNGSRGAQTSLSNEDLVDQKALGIPGLPPARQGLYDPTNEHDACGLGFIAHIKGEKNHAIVTQGLQILKNLTHRGATGADPLQGDGDRQSTRLNSSH